MEQTWRYMWTMLKEVEPDTTRKGGDDPAAAIKEEDNVAGGSQTLDEGASGIDRSHAAIKKEVISEEQAEEK